MSYLSLIALKVRSKCDNRVKRYNTLTSKSDAALFIFVLHSFTMMLIVLVNCKDNASNCFLKCLCNAFLSSLACFLSDFF
jgi:hypothetical protein